MDEKTEFLICLSASTAANCVPCFEYYFRKAALAGVKIDEVRRAVELACKVKTGSGIAMKNSIRDTTGQDWDSGSESNRADYPCCR